MPDYRKSGDLLEDDHGHIPGSDYEPAPGPSDFSWGWIAGAISMVIIFIIAFGVGHAPNRVASNDFAPTATPRVESPVTGISPATPSPAPGLTPPPSSPTQP